MIRLAVKNDIKRVFLWRNTPEIMKSGGLKSSVSWRTHQEWYARAILGKDTLLYIIEPKCGAVRLDKKEDSAEISVYVLPDYQNQGRGTAAIKSATQKGFDAWQVKEIVAYILDGNEISKKSFEKAGYFEQVSGRDGHVCMVKE